MVVLIFLRLGFYPKSNHKVLVFYASPKRVFFNEIFLLCLLLEVKLIKLKLWLKNNFVKRMLQRQCE